MTTTDDAQALAIQNWEYLLGEISAHKIVLNDGVLDSIDAYLRAALQPKDAAAMIYTEAQDKPKSALEKWFFWDNVDIRGLHEFLTYIGWETFVKGGVDKHGKYIVFLYKEKISVGAIRCQNTGAYQSLLGILRGDEEVLQAYAKGAK